MRGFAPLAIENAPPRRVFALSPPGGKRAFPQTPFASGPANTIRTLKGLGGTAMTSPGISLIDAPAGSTAPSNPVGGRQTPACTETGHSWPGPAWRRLGAFQPCGGAPSRVQKTKQAALPARHVIKHVTKGSYDAHLQSAKSRVSI